MSGPSLVALIGLLVAALLVVVALLVWQESKRRAFDPGPIYYVNEAVRFVTDRLEGPTAERLRRADVRRILEWELHYLQGLAQPNRRNPVETYAGGADTAIDYIEHQIAQHHGVSYSRDDIREVLHREAEYLKAIGAVGDRVSEEASGGDES